MFFSQKRLFKNGFRTLPDLANAVTLLFFQFPFNLGMINVGAPACGKNAAMRSFVRLALTSGFGVSGIHFGFEGLLQDHVTPMGWTEVQGWTGVGGTKLGTTR